MAVNQRWTDAQQPAGAGQGWAVGSLKWWQAGASAVFASVELGMGFDAVIIAYLENALAAATSALLFQKLHKCVCVCACTRPLHVLVPCRAMPCRAMHVCACAFMLTCMRVYHAFVRACVHVCMLARACTHA